MKTYLVTVEQTRECENVIRYLARARSTTPLMDIARRAYPDAYCISVLVEQDAKDTGLLATNGSIITE